MAQCMYCNKKGFFLTVDKFKLCKTCSPVVIRMAKDRIRIIKESEKIINTSKKYETRINRCDDVILQATELQRLKDKGVVLEGDIDLVVDTYIKMKKTLIIEYAQNKTQEYLSKVKLAKSKTAKLNNADKALLFINDLKNEYNIEVDSLIIEFLNLKHAIELEDLLLIAEKEEFKGNTKKAIDKYQDALFFLKKDDIPDEIQSKEINALENKINELQSLSK